MTEINDFIDALFAEARKQGLDEWQVKYVESESSDIQVFEQKAVSYTHLTLPTIA